MSVTTFSVSVANGASVIELKDGTVGQLELQLTGAAPAAGTLKVEGLAWANGTYYGIGGGSAIDLAALAAGPIRLSDYGHFQSLRLTFSGVTGGGGVLTGSAASFAVSVADQAFSGQRALLTQSYDEANCKNGLQFYFQKALPTFSAGATYNIVFTTGALPVLIKDRALYTNATSFSLQLFKAPTGVTGGTAITVQNYNDINPAATTVSVLGGATVTAPGIAWGDPEHIYNAASSGQRTASDLAPRGDRVLAPNKSYLMQLINVAGTANADYYLTWYEGEPDLPRK